jgi:hypothetical protein
VATQEEIEKLERAANDAADELHRANHKYGKGSLEAFPAVQALVKASQALQQAKAEK